MRGIPNPLSKQDLLREEIESRMHSLICGYLAEEEKTDHLALAYMRAAYAFGYADCYKEPDNIRGEAFKKLGYGIFDKS